MNMDEIFQEECMRKERQDKSGKIWPVRTGSKNLVKERRKKWSESVGEQD